MVNFNFCDISKIIKDITPVLSLIVVFQLCFSGIKIKKHNNLTLIINCGIPVRSTGSFIIKLTTESVF